MPELAEVELIRRGLDVLVGSRIERVEVFDWKLEALPVSYLEGRAIVGTSRHGKLLGLDLDGGEVLAFHLRMTGNLLLEDHPRARLKLHFARSDAPGGETLSFVDPRRFGTVVLTAKEHFGETAGPDLLDMELTPAVLARRAGRSRRAVKTVLLDQQVVAGVGNYMVDEALWAARVAPERPASALDGAAWRRVHRALRTVAERALESGGASFRDYRRADGELGSMQEGFRAYGRSGLPCLRCKTTLQRTVVGGRGTTYCPSCQRADSQES